MKKILIITTLIVVLYAFTAVQVYAVTIGDMVKRNMESADMGSLDNIITEDEVILPDFEFSDTAQMFAAGVVPFDTGDLLSGILKSFFSELYVSLALLIKIVAIAVIFSLLNNMRSNFSSEGVSNTAFLVCYVLLAGVMIESFIQIASLAQAVVSGITTFVSGVVPIIITTMMTAGEISTATAINPIILLSTNVVTNVVNNFLLPIYFAIAVLSVVDNLNEKFPITKMTDVLKKTAKWVLGLMMTIFVGLLGICGFTSSILDGTAGKATKYVVSSFVPIVGGVLSETVDTVAGCSIVMKNAMGSAGIIAIIVICLTPILKAAAVSAMFHLTSAVVEPICDSRISKTISSIGSVIGLMAVTMIVVALMFIICVTMMIGLGNNAAMLR